MKRSDTQLKTADCFREAQSPDLDNIEKIFRFIKLTKFYNLI